MRAALLVFAVLATGCSSNSALAFAVAMNSLPEPKPHPTPEVTEVSAPTAAERDGSGYRVALDLGFVADHPVTDVLVQVLETRSDELTRIAPPHARTGVARIRTKLPHTDARALTLRVTLIDERGVAGTPVIKKIALL